MLNILYEYDIMSSIDNIEFAIPKLALSVCIQGEGRTHWTVNYTGTQSFITTLYYLTCRLKNFEHFY